MGRLYKGGMWFKKKSVLLAEGNYNTEKSADGTTDLRTSYKDYTNGNRSINNSGLPSAADAGNYFYLPALGYYYYGQLYDVGYSGFYWSSSAYPSGTSSAYTLNFSSGGVTVYNDLGVHGYRVEAFQ